MVVSELELLILLFSRINIHRMNHAPAAHISAMPALIANGKTNRGSDHSGQMYYAKSAVFPHFPMELKSLPESISD
jgi:hypothetical protein